MTVIRGRKLRSEITPIEDNDTHIKHVRIRLNVDGFSSGWDSEVKEYFEITGICSEEMAREILRRFNNP